MNTPTGKRIKIRRQGRYQGLPFSGSHFCDSALVESNPAYDLHIVVALSQHPPGGLPHDGKSINEKFIKGLATLMSLFEFSGFCLELSIIQRFDFRLKTVYLFEIRTEFL
jgi:hypothetical protein